MPSSTTQSPKFIDTNLPQFPETTNPDFFKTGTRIYNALRILQQAISLFAYPVVFAGGDPTGVLDSTVGINNAVNKLASAGRGALFLSEGTYVITDVVSITKPGIKLVGAGATRTIIKQMTSAKEVIKISNAGLNCEISDITLTYNPAAVPAAGNTAVDCSGTGLRLVNVTALNINIGYNLLAEFAYIRACTVAVHNSIGCRINTQNVIVCDSAFSSTTRAGIAGIRLTTLAANLSITNNYCTGALQNYGIEVVVGNAAGYDISDNNVIGNALAGIIDGGLIGPAVGSRVVDNIGYNPVGVAPIVPGASPWTYQAGHTYETMYIDGVCMVDVTSGIGAFVPAFAAGPTATIHLGPNDRVKLTYGVLPICAISLH